MSTQQKCPIWGTDAEYLVPLSSSGATVRSWRTDGEFRITAEAMDAVRLMLPKGKALLTTWIVDQRRSGEIAPFINDDAIDRISTSRPLRFSQKKQRFFLLAQSRDFQPSSVFRISGVVDEQMKRDTGAISAWTECQTDQDRSALLRLLKEEGLINFGGSNDVTLTSKGFEFLESLESGGAALTHPLISEYASDPLKVLACETAWAKAAIRGARRCSGMLGIRS